MFLSKCLNFISDDYSGLCDGGLGGGNGLVGVSDGLGGGGGLGGGRDVGGAGSLYSGGLSLLVFKSNFIINVVLTFS